MRRVTAIFLVFVLLLSVSSEISMAHGYENVWSSTVNYLNQGDYTDDQLIDCTFFDSIIGVSDDYLVIPLYDLLNRISAYVVQYYDEGNPLSYVVINTGIVDEDYYYIEFGEGDFANIVGLGEVGEDADVIQVCYCGGSQYYLKIDDALYHFEENLSELDLDLIAELEQRSYGNYYNLGETLTYTAVLNKEVGYDSVSSYSKSTAFTKRTTTMTQNAYGSGITLDKHCAPTAALNLMQYLYTIASKANIPMSSWQSVFIALHTAMGTTNSNGTNDSAVAPAYQSVLSSYGYNSASASIQYSASWSQVTSAINANAVHLILHDSEIYANHSVVGLGYVSFSHSTGWVSKYYKIVDGWTADIRYVHSSLGIGSIDLVTVYVGS